MSPVSEFIELNGDFDLLQQWMKHYITPTASGILHHAICWCHRGLQEPPPFNDD